MMEQPDAAERHRNAVLVAGVDHLCVADGAARLHNGSHAAAACALNVVAEREKGITAKADTGLSIQPCAFSSGFTVQIRSAAPSLLPSTGEDKEGVVSVFP